MNGSKCYTSVRLSMIPSIFFQNGSTSTEGFGICRIILAGFPPITTLSGNDLVTTAPAPTMTLFPSVTYRIMNILKAIFI